jgi:hypothetical protein
MEETKNGGEDEQLLTLFREHMDNNEYGTQLLQRISAAHNFLSLFESRGDTIARKVLALYKKMLLLAKTMYTNGNIQSLVNGILIPEGMKKIFAAPLKDNPQFAKDLQNLNEGESSSKVFWSCGRLKHFLSEHPDTYSYLLEPIEETLRPQFEFWLKVIFLDDRSEFCRFKDENVFISVAVFTKTLFIGLPSIDFSKFRLPFGKTADKTELSRTSGQVYVRCQFEDNSSGYIQFGGKQMIRAFYTNNHQLFNGDAIESIKEDDANYLKYLFTNGFLDDSVKTVSKQYALDIYQKAIRDPELEEKGKYAAFYETLQQVEYPDRETTPWDIPFKAAQKQTRYETKEQAKANCRTNLTKGRKFGYSISNLGVYKRIDKTDDKPYYVCGPTVSGGAKAILDRKEVNTLPDAVEAMVLFFSEIQKQYVAKKLQLLVTRKGSIVPAFVLKNVNKSERGMALRMIQLRFLVFGFGTLTETNWKTYNALLPVFLDGSWKDTAFNMEDLKPHLQDAVSYPKLCPKLIAQYESEIFEDCARGDLDTGASAASGTAVPVGRGTAPATPGSIQFSKAMPMPARPSSRAFSATGSRSTQQELSVKHTLTTQNRKNLETAKKAGRQMKAYKNSTGKSKPVEPKAPSGTNLWTKMDLVGQGGPEPKTGAAATQKGLQKLPQTWPQAAVATDWSSENLQGLINRAAVQLAERGEIVPVVLDQMSDNYANFSDKQKTEYNSLYGQHALQAMLGQIDRGELQPPFYTFETLLAPLADDLKTYYTEELKKRTDNLDRLREQKAPVPMDAKKVAEKPAASPALASGEYDVTMDADGASECESSFVLFEQEFNVEGKISEETLEKARECFPKFSTDQRKRYENILSQQQLQVYLINTLERNAQETVKKLISNVSPPGKQDWFRQQFEAKATARKEKWDEYMSELLGLNATNREQLIPKVKEFGELSPEEDNQYAVAVLNDMVERKDGNPGMFMKDIPTYINKLTDSKQRNDFLARATIRGRQAQPKTVAAAAPAPQPAASDVGQRIEEYYDELEAMADKGIIPADRNKIYTKFHNMRNQRTPYEAQTDADRDRLRSILAIDDIMKVFNRTNQYDKQAANNLLRQITNVSDKQRLRALLDEKFEKSGPQTSTMGASSTITSAAAPKPDAQAEQRKQEREAKIQGYRDILAKFAEIIKSGKTFDQSVTTDNISRLVGPDHHKYHGGNDIKQIEDDLFAKNRILGFIKTPATLGSEDIQSKISYNLNLITTQEDKEKFARLAAEAIEKAQQSETVAAVPVLSEAPPKAAPFTTLAAGSQQKIAYKLFLAELAEMLEQGNTFIEEEQAQRLSKLLDGMNTSDFAEEDKQRDALFEQNKRLQKLQEFIKDLYNSRGGLDQAEAAKNFQQFEPTTPKEQAWFNYELAMDNITRLYNEIKPKTKYEEDIKPQLGEYLKYVEKTNRDDMIQKFVEKIEESKIESTPTGRPTSKPIRPFKQTFIDGALKASNLDATAAARQAKRDKEQRRLRQATSAQASYNLVLAELAEMLGQGNTFVEEEQAQKLSKLLDTNTSDFTEEIKQRDALFKQNRRLLQQMSAEAAPAPTSVMVHGTERDKKLYEFLIELYNTRGKLDQAQATARFKEFEPFTEEETAQFNYELTIDNITKLFNGITSDTKEEHIKPRLDEYLKHVKEKNRPEIIQKFIERLATSKQESTATGRPVTVPLNIKRRPFKKALDPEKIKEKRMKEAAGNRLQKMLDQAAETRKEAAAQLLADVPVLEEAPERAAAAVPTSLPALEEAPQVAFVPESKAAAAPLGSEPAIEAAAVPLLLQVSGSEAAAAQLLPTEDAVPVLEKAPLPAPEPAPQVVFVPAEPATAPLVSVPARIAPADEVAQVEARLTKNFNDPTTDWKNVKNTILEEIGKLPKENKRVWKTRLEKKLTDQHVWEAEVTVLDKKRESETELETLWDQARRDALKDQTTNPEELAIDIIGNGEQLWTKALEAPTTNPEELPGFEDSEQPWAEVLEAPTPQELPVFMSKSKIPWTKELGKQGKLKVIPRWRPEKDPIQSQPAGFTDIQWSDYKTMIEHENPNYDFTNWWVEKSTKK